MSEASDPSVPLTDPAQRGRVSLAYFDDVLPREIAAINRRRREVDSRRGPSDRRGHVGLNPPDPNFTAKKSAEHGRFEQARPPDRRHARSDLFARVAEGIPPPPPRGVDPDNPDYARTRPRPIPCTATGLAFSGGGIRSAAVNLGVLQALHRYRAIDSIDYLSTVSGGGYVGASLSAAMSAPQPGHFPFGDDVADTSAIAHLRNFSNYLLPRGRSAIRNMAEAAAVILRGIVTNVLLVLMALLLLALLTHLAYPTSASLVSGSFVPRLIDGGIARIGELIGLSIAPPFGLIGSRPLVWAIGAAALTVVALIVWTLLRSMPGAHRWDEDADSVAIRCARVLIITTVTLAVLDLQPLAIAQFLALQKGDWHSTAQQIGLAAGAFSSAMSILASRLGKFLHTTEHSGRLRTLLLRGVTHLGLFVAALVLPILLWVAYLALAAWALDGHTVAVPLLGERRVTAAFLVVFIILFVFELVAKPNAYSLHRFYRDRIAKAFLFDPHRWIGPDPEPLTDLKLSQLHDDAPYHLINAAMNIQGSAEANRRGRNADFFLFSRYAIGSDLTLYTPLIPLWGPTETMEQIDPRLDLGTAAAISGAALSANMGSSTVRLMSPTLALLNVRLGYWLRNPRDLARQRPWLAAWRGAGFWRRWPAAAIALLASVPGLFHRAAQRLYLLREMLNLLDENSQYLLLTDGGHIENLGIYELLKRGCRLIVAIDAEADPAMACPSLVKLERYARIDLGVRITLPWEKIAEMTHQVSANLHAGRARGLNAHGPHCAVGRIVYEDGAVGVLLYFKSSLSGDEKDYIVDYKTRYRDFPHETTGDQFFSEEQFEAYRALGFHMLDGFLGGNDSFAFLDHGAGGWATAAEAYAEVRRLFQTAAA